jgi:hypothetical protein
VTSPEWKALNKKLKNARRRNRRKKLLPPLPPDLRADPYDFYKDFHNINLDDYQVRKTYYTHSLPPYKKQETMASTIKYY